MHFADIQQNLASQALRSGTQHRAMLQRESSTRYVMPYCHFVGGNYWILKTTYQNRGIGIHVFRCLEQLNKILQNYITIAKDEPREGASLPKGHSPYRPAAAVTASPYLAGHRDRQTIQPGDDSHWPGRRDEERRKLQAAPAQNHAASPPEAVPSFMNSPIQVPKNMSFIIQKYIERPLLINKRKFDIRVWVLVNQDMEVFFFKEGYLRTAAVEYKLDDGEDQYVHLTNNAVQKNGRSYGRFEDGNQLDFDQFQEYLDENHNK